MINSRFSRQVKDPEQFLSEDSDDMTGTGGRSKESRIVTPSRYHVLQDTAWIQMLPQDHLAAPHPALYLL